MGYPESFDDTKSEYRVLIELMHISDCLDAATDFIGRSYKRQKSLDECLMEFEQEQGSVYSPDIVDLQSGEYRDFLNNVMRKKEFQ